MDAERGPKEAADPAAAESGASQGEQRGKLARELAGDRERERAGDEQAAGMVERDLDELLRDTQRERDEYLDLAQRTRADFENYRRRATQEASEAERRGKIALARELVPILDNLERALRSAGVDPEAADDAAAAGDGGGIVHGVVLVYRQLRSALEAAGVEAYDPTGERFDPTWHEALATRADEATEPGIVLETLEKGYRLNGQVLRAARVVVSE
ncbi:MAG TPA: nucleotide exchange factor GrpE [Solirubrobacterales bacterium]|jgi:molecular chaperone GrpE|nr:nucleotide exchange factor GrpE [Solirubrobacterales bacterium]